MSELVEIIFYELPKLEEKVKVYFEGKQDLKNLPEEEKWCIYLKYRKEKHAGELVEALCREEEGIMRVENALRGVSRDYDRWANALFREKVERDYRSEMSSARMAGEARGMARGRTEGEVTGIIKGYEQARQEYEGKLEKASQEKLEIARKMKGRGRPLSEIVEDTGLPPETVENL